MWSCPARIRTRSRSRSDNARRGRMPLRGARIERRRDRPFQETDMPLMISAVNADANGHSYFSKVNVLDSQERERSQAIECWQTWETLPGFYAPLKTVEKPVCVVLISGKLEVTTSNGEKRYFSHGEVFLLQDTTG